MRTTAENHFQDVRLISFRSEHLNWRPGDVLTVRPKNSNEQINELFDIFQEHGFDFGPDTIVQLSEIDMGKNKQRIHTNFQSMVRNLFVFLFF